MVELAAGGQDDLVPVAALPHVQDRVADHLVADADAAGAHDAALGVVDDRRTEADPLGLVHRLGALALEVPLVLEPVVLELALTGLVADGAIDRVVEQQELLHRVLSLLHLFADRVDLHALGRLDLAGGHELRLGVRHVGLLGLVEAHDRHLHLPTAGDVHQAHTAVGGDAETGVPAVVGDLDPGPPGGPHDRVALLEGDGLTVQGKGRHSETQRSHSPPIMLTEPKVGTMSAIMSPMSISRAACRLYQHGGRTRTR